MLVSHECPISLLKESRNFNDYDYALIHLFEKYPEYKEFFKESLKQGRMVILDNSLFELEEMFDHQKFYKEAKELSKINSKNFYYIVPDKLEDCETTINSFKEFTKKYKIDGNKIGVVQGKNFDEILKCFEFMKENADVIGISFDYNYYLETIEEGNKFEKFMKGRINLINYLHENNLLKDTKIHLLGCSLPQEFKFYRNIPEIFSIDTSNPIVHGIKNVRYNKEGLNDKITIKLVDLIDYNGSFKNIKLNVRDFRLVNNIFEVKKPSKQELLDYVKTNVEDSILKTYLKIEYDFDELAIYHNEKIIGFVSARFKEDFYKIYYLHIIQKYRGLGLGKYLLDEITKNVDKYLYVTDETTDGLSMFKNQEPFKIVKNEFGNNDYYFIIDKTKKEIK